MKLYIKASKSTYSNSIRYKEPGKYGAGPVYWGTRVGDRIVDLLEQFSRDLDSNPDIASWEIYADGGEVKIRFETVDGENYPYWSFQYSSLKSDNARNISWLRKGLRAVLGL